MSGTSTPPPMDTANPSWYGVYTPNSAADPPEPPSTPPSAPSASITQGNGATEAPRSNAPTPASQSPVGDPVGQSSAQDLNQNLDYDPLRAEKEGKVREVGGQAVWSLSSCKPGYGVDQLRDDSSETYWQSDGPQPHLVNIQFRRKTAVRDVCIYADYKQDESYTPSRISIRAGNHFNDLQEIEAVDLQEPTGWTFIPLQSLLSNKASTTPKPLRTFMVQIAVLSNHQNGRDTHMRQIKIFAPVEGGPVGVAKMSNAPFTTNEFSRYSCIR